MQKLNADFRLDGFAARFERASQRILMLDYDGTLAPFRAERDKAIPYPGVRERIVRSMQEPRNRVLVISGRSIDSIRPLLGVEPPPEIWGSHGIERLVEGSYRTAGEADILREGVAAAIEWAKRNGRDDVLERKPFGVAFHWRSMDDAEREALRRQVHGEWAEKVAEYQMSLHEFDGGLELRAKALNKGHAVRHVLDNRPPDSVAAYLGDDLTDEDAFRELAADDLRVLVRTELRETQADIQLQPPDEMFEFLDWWLDPAQNEPRWLRA